MLINYLLKLREELSLPWYDYELNVANHLIDELYAELKEKSVPLMIDEKIKTIQDCIREAEDLFAKEKKESGRNQIKPEKFVYKKIRIKRNLSVLLKKVEERQKKMNLQKNG
jgi:hypothetical protein